MSQATPTSRLQEIRNWRPTRDQGLRFAISLLLSLLLWGWITQLQDPFESRQIAGNDIELGRIPDNLQVVTSLPAARVTVSGSRSEVESIRQADLTVTADTSGISRAGTFQVPLIVDGADVSDVTIDPGEVTIQVDDRISIVLPLRIEKTEASGELVTASEIVPRVSQVTVTGPASAVNRVQEVILPVTIDVANTNYDASIIPVAIDATGQPITEVQILPESVLIQVEVQRQGKAVSVIPNVIGLPQEGYVVQQRAALPETIVVDGPEELLTSLLFVNTEPVDVSGESGSVSTMVGISDLPQGLTIIEPSDGQIEVRVAIEDSTTSSQTIAGLPIEVLGLEPGYTSSVTPETVSIDVSASAEVLQQMTPADIIVLVDVSTLGPGTHVLTPEVSLPPGATWSPTQIEDWRIRIVIAPSTIATPASTGSATPAPETPSP